MGHLAVMGFFSILFSYLGSGTARGNMISVSEMPLFDWCMMFLLCCVTPYVLISTCVVSF